MSDQNSSSGQSSNPVDTEAKQTDTVKYETYQKVLNEKKRRDEELRQAREKLEAYETEKVQAQEFALREKEDFKKLFESRDNELKTTREQLSGLQESINNSKKISSFLSALNEPLEQNYWGLVDLEKIAIDPNSGKPDEQIVRQYADEFRKNNWRLFDSTGARMPNHVGDTTKQNGLTVEQWKKLTYSEQKKRLKDIVE